MRFLLFILYVLTAVTGFAEEKKYGSFILNTDIPDTLFFIDEIKANDSFELRKALRNHEIQNIVLASPGGSVWEGLQMAGIVFDKKLRTYIPRGGTCASACSYLFFAGNERLAEGELGVHQAYSENFKEKKAVGQTQYVTQFTVSEIIGFLNEFKTPSFVYERMFQDIDMYYFTDIELASLNSDDFNLSPSKRIKLSDNSAQLLQTRIKGKRDLPASNETDDNEPVIEEPSKIVESDETQILLIRKIQKRLKEIGCNPGKIDGIWGKRTEAAALLFAKEAGLAFQSKNFITPQFLDRLNNAQEDFCPKSKVELQQPASQLEETWDGYVICHSIIGKMPRSILIKHLDKAQFAILFPRGMCGNGNPIEVTYQTQNDVKSGHYTFSHGSVDFFVEVDFERSIIKGSTKQNSLIENTANLLLLGNGKGQFYFSK